MEIDTNKNYAVITGDIIRFKRLGLETRKGAYRLMTRCSARIKKAMPETIAGNIWMFRGDGWQMLVIGPKFALRAALFVKAFLIAASPGGARIDTRMAIGVGRIDYIPAQNVTAGDGEAFRASGKRFDRLGKTGAGCLVFTNPEMPENERLDNLADQAGRIAGNWRPDQADAFVRFLEKAGKNILKEKPESASKLPSRDWAEIMGIITAFEGLFPEQSEYYRFDHFSKISDL